MYKMNLPVTLRPNIFVLANKDFEGLFQDYRNINITTLKLIILDTGIRLFHWIGKWIEMPTPLYSFVTEMWPPQSTSAGLKTFSQHRIHHIWGVMHKKGKQGQLQSKLHSLFWHIDLIIFVYFPKLSSSYWLSFSQMKPLAKLPVFQDP